MNSFALEINNFNEVLDRAVDGAHLSYTRVYWRDGVKTTTTAEGPAFVVGDRVCLDFTYDIRDSKRVPESSLTEVRVTANVPEPCYLGDNGYMDALWGGVGVDQELELRLRREPGDTIVIRGILRERDGNLYIQSPWLVMDGVEGSRWLQLTIDGGTRPHYETQVSGITAYRPQEFVWRGALCEENHNTSLERLRQKLMGI